MEVKQLFEDIKNYNTIIIHRHTRPDLDAHGSQLGLKKIIEANYPSKKVFAVGDSTQKYAFIGDMDIVSDDLYKGALVIIVDVAVAYMISDERYKLADKVWVIDHHKNDCDVSENWLCDTTRVAAAEYITYLVLEEGLTIP
jgi:phosphoesterase RecJ-like protein